MAAVVTVVSAYKLVNSVIVLCTGNLLEECIIGVARTRLCKALL
jgi:hypothetical protein